MKTSHQKTDEVVDRKILQVERKGDPEGTGVAERLRIWFPNVSPLSQAKGRQQTEFETVALVLAQIRFGSTGRRDEKAAWITKYSGREEWQKHKG